MQLPPGLIVSVSGVRGRVGRPLTPEIAAFLASAYGAFLLERDEGDLLLVGRDTRVSGPMFSRAVIAGLQSVGCRVADLGVVATPTLLLAVRDRGAVGGIGVTASHNPAEWNALKFAAGEGMLLDGEGVAAFEAFRARGRIQRAEWDAIQPVGEDRTAVSRHLQRILQVPHVDSEALRQRRFRVALDCGRGAGAEIMGRLLEQLGCRVVAIGMEADGRFHRDPEPTEENLGELGRVVRESGADVGFAVDPDVDRLALVDERGEPLGEERTLALAAEVAMRRKPGTIVTNLSTSQLVEDVAARYSGSVVRSPVGEINVARRMQEEGAVIGGEGNGGVILPDLHYTRDAPMGTALILQHLLDEREPLSELAGRWPRYVIVKEKAEGSKDDLERVGERFAREEGAEEVDRSDGVRLRWPEERKWLHVRASGTEPVLRLIAEAPSAAEARRLASRARALLAKARGAGGS